MLKYIGFMEELSEDSLYCDGILLIKVGLPADRIVEIFKEHLLLT